jgi:hypothetical protein
MINIKRSLFCHLPTLMLVFVYLLRFQTTDSVHRIQILVSFMLEATAHRVLINVQISDKEAAIAGVLEDDSPYPEVRSAVANTDDVTLPVGTMRSWVLGVVWAMIIPVRLRNIIRYISLNFFSNRV